jgi:hypothetical protein
MRFPTQITKLFRLFKFVLLSSAVLTRTAGGTVDPDTALENEMAWMAVREGLAGATDIGVVPDRARRLVAGGLGDGFESRVRESYLEVSVDAISALDALWMERLAEANADAASVDGFLAARSETLPGIIDLELAQAGADATSKWGVYERVFKFAPYDAGN